MPRPMVPAPATPATRSLREGSSMGLPEKRHYNRRGILGRGGRGCQEGAPQSRTIKRVARGARSRHMKYRKILLAYNGSNEGKRALLECAELANFLGAETHLLAVASMPPSLFLTEGFVPEELLEEEQKRTQTVLDEGIRSLTDKGFKAAGELAVDLIVIGHNQKTSFAARWWKGSVGASLLDYAPCSILIALSRS